MKTEGFLPFPRPSARAVLFDMDGTILDTLPGLQAALNEVLRSLGEPERTRDEVRRFVGNGQRKLLERALRGGAGRPDFDAVVDRYEKTYAAMAADGTVPYPGILETVAALHARGVATAVVTNKEEDAARALVDRFFPGSFDAVAGGLPGHAPKPDPNVPRRALAALGVQPREALYVGDSEVDAATANAAGLPLLLCPWGFRDPAALAALGPVSTCPADILAAAGV